MSNFDEASMITRMQREEYTGENRCFPCTVANLGILVLVCVILVVRSWVLAAGIGVMGVIIISFRGYLIPFTPIFMKKFKQSSLYRVIEPKKGLPDEESVSGGEFSGEEIITELLRVNVLQAPNDDDLELTPTFVSKWNQIIDDISTDSIEAFEEWANAAINNREIDDINAVDLPWVNPYIVVSLSSGEEVTLSYPIAIAELSALKALEITNGSDLLSLRSAGPLRAFLRHCPKCGSSLESSTYSGCCGSSKPGDEIFGLVCPECREMYFKYPD